MFLFLKTKAESYDSAFVGFINEQQEFSYESLEEKTLKHARNLYEQEEYKKSLKLVLPLLESENVKTKIQANLLIGEIHFTEKTAKQSLSYFKKSLKLIDYSNELIDAPESLGLDKEKAQNLSYLGRIYLFNYIKKSEVEVNIDSAHFFLNRLVDIESLDKDVLLLKAKAYNNLSAAEFNKEVYSKAREYANKAITIFIGLENKKELSMSYMNLANLYEVSNKRQKAIDLYLKALQFVENKKDQKSMEFKENLYFNIAWSLYNLKDYKAYDYMYKSYNLKDSLVDLNLRKELKKIEQIHNVDLIKKDAETKQHELEKNILILGAIFTLILVSLIYLIVVSKLRHKNLTLESSQKEAVQQKRIDTIQIESQEKIINAALDAKEKERKKIAETLHDNVSAMLSSANMHLKASKKHFEKVPEEIEKTQQIIAETSIKVRDLSHNLVPSVLLKFGLEFAIKEVTQKYSNSSIKFIAIASSINRYNQEFEIKIFNIVQELMNNILKHSKAKIAYVVLEENAGLLEIIVKDDGVGIPKGYNYNLGIGLSQIKARIRQLKGSIKFENPNEKGTKITLEIPVLDKELTTFS